MALDNDLPSHGFTWRSAPSHRWATAALRLHAGAWMLLFEHEHSWVRRRSMEAQEFFADSGVSASTPRGPTNLVQNEPDFMQRPGTPTLLISTVRSRDGRRFEVSLPFTQGNSSPMDTLLSSARVTLVTLEVNSR